MRINLGWYLEDRSYIFATSLSQGHGNSSALSIMVYREHDYLDILHNITKVYGTDNILVMILALCSLRSRRSKLKKKKDCKNKGTSLFVLNCFLFASCLLMLPMSITPERCLHPCSSTSPPVPASILFTIF